jgi:hypothetical protein
MEKKSLLTGSLGIAETVITVLHIS